MNTPNLSLKLGGLASALIFSVVLAGSAQAGSGLQVSQTHGTATAHPTSSEKMGIPDGVCPGSEIVSITRMKPSLPNGRGALVAVQIGTKRVCHMCRVSTVTAVKAWPSHRGPLTNVQTTEVGPAHNCTAGCASSAKT